MTLRLVTTTDARDGPMPGQREMAMLTRFGAPTAEMPSIAEAPGTMSLQTIADRQREGGGAPSQRRPAPTGSRWTRMTAWLIPRA